MQGRLVVAVVVIAAAYVLALAGLAFAAGETQVVTHDNQKDWKIDAAGGAVTFAPATGCDAPSARGTGALHRSNRGIRHAIAATKHRMTNR